MASKLDRLQKKGFKVNEAALSKIARGDQEPGGEYSEININDIEENPDNALYRELDTEEDIALLADDIRRAGLLHNLVVFLRPVLAENMCCFPASAACVRCACWWSRINASRKKSSCPTA